MENENTRSEVIHGRGAASNPTNRFERLSISIEESESDAWEERVSPQTVFLHDATRTIIAYNDSPDVGFSAGINAYRGCEHGCIYCYARPFHEYLGFSAGVDFETKILVKKEAPRLLREELMAKSWKPQTLAMSGVTDCYQPAERYFRLTRACLEVLNEFRNPVGIITKNQLVTRDIDLLSEMATRQICAVFVTITTLDTELCNVLEPRTSRPKARLEALAQLSAAGIPTGVMVAPSIPGLTDHEIPAILTAAREAGAKRAGVVPLRLPGAVSDLFLKWLKNHRPERRDKVMHFIQSVRGGRMNDPRFGNRMRGEGAFAQHIRDLFKLWCRKLGLNQSDLELSTAGFRRPTKQLGFFDPP